MEIFLLHSDIAKTQPWWLSQFSFSKLRQPTGQRLSNVRTQQTKISTGPILFLYYEESLVSLNLNSNQLRFHGAHPNAMYVPNNFASLEPSLFLLDSILFEFSLLSCNKLKRSFSVLGENTVSGSSLISSGNFNLDFFSWRCSCGFPLSSR